MALTDPPPPNQKDLLPCPFCGSIQVYCGTASATGRHVWCQSCGAQSKSFGLPAVNPKNLTMRQLWRELDVMAKAAWNKRADL